MSSAGKKKSTPKGAFFLVLLRITVFLIRLDLIYLIVLMDLKP